ncbi:hypothetical protein Tco_1556662 [Tanacetum coccineum]
MDEWSKSQNISLEQIDRTDPPPPQAHTEHVNAVFTGSKKSDDSLKIQKDSPPPIIVNNKIKKDSPSPSLGEAQAATRAEFNYLQPYKRPTAEYDQKYAALAESAAHFSPELKSSLTPQSAAVLPKGCEALVKRDTPDQQRSVKCIFRKNILSQEISGRAKELEEIQDNLLKTLEKFLWRLKVSSNLKRKLFLFVDRVLNRLCLNVEVEEHSLGDPNEPSNYKAVILDWKSDKWLNPMNVEMQSMKDNQV